MKRFNMLKKKFKKDHSDMKMTLPPPLDNKNIPYRVEGGEITIT